MVGRAARAVLVAALVLVAGHFLGLLEADARFFLAFRLGRGGELAGGRALVAAHVVVFDAGERLALVPALVDVLMPLAALGGAAVLVGQLDTTFK